MDMGCPRYAGSSYYMSNKIIDNNMVSLGD